MSRRIDFLARLLTLGGLACYNQFRKIPAVGPAAGKEAFHMDENLAYQEEQRAELIDGKVVMMAPPTINHNRVVINLAKIFSNYLDGKTCEPFSDGAEVHLTDKDHFVPDFMVVCDPDKVGSKYVQGAPDLVVEILSRSTMRNAKTHKKDVYGRCGVREYWLIHPEDKSVEVYRSNGSELVLFDIYVLDPDCDLESMAKEQHATVDTHFKCSLFDDLDISLKDIFYRTI